MPEDQLFLENPEHKLAPEVAKVFSARRAQHAEMLALRNQNDLSQDARKRFTDSKRRSYRTAAERATLDVEEFTSSMTDAVAVKNSAIADAIKGRIDRSRGWDVVRPKLEFPKPEETDHTFWWSDTSAFVAPSTTADFRDDGLHFFGGPKVNDYDGEMHTSFGATARFALQPERRPSSATGWFMSSPHVEIFGGIVAFAPDWDLIQGDGIASCTLFLRQTIFQWGFGPTGPAPLVVGQATNDNAWRHYLRNTGYSLHGDMPGFKPMPAVGFHESQFIGHQELWAELEVRFDIYLNTTGALVWCDPEVLLRMFQWPLVPA